MESYIHKSSDLEKSVLKISIEESNNTTNLEVSSMNVELAPVVVEFLLIIAENSETAVASASAGIDGTYGLESMDASLTPSLPSLGAWAHPSGLCTLRDARPNLLNDLSSLTEWPSIPITKTSQRPMQVEGLENIRAENCLKDSLEKLIQGLRNLSQLTLLRS